MISNPVWVQTQSGVFDLTASVTSIGHDLLVAIWGGKPHIGAVALAQARKSIKDPEKLGATSSVLCILGHNEDYVVKAVSERLASLANCSVVVVAGMHWDNVGDSDLQQISRNVETLIHLIEPYLHICREGESSDFARDCHREDS
jgi:gallate decarboxylase subunit D